ncbi:MAG TPA: cytochrome c [Acidimicrobiia bacterium]|jgi:mono/diheme cytochrome c family protein
MRIRALSVLLMLLAAACTGPADPNASGDELYAQFCARCHGVELGGGVGPALGADSPAVERSDTYLADAIGNGRGSMPAFGNTLSDVQIDRVVDFIRAEQGP